MIKNSQNIIIVIFRGIFRFFLIGFSAFLALIYIKKTENLPKKFPFLEEMIESWPKRFFAFPTAIKLGRAIFAPILFLFAQKNNDKNSSQK